MPEISYDSSREISVRLNGIDEKLDIEKLNLEQLLFLVQSEKLADLKSSITDKLKELHPRQQEVKQLHEIIAHLNQRVSDEGNLTIEEGSNEEQLLMQAQELGVKLDRVSGQFNPQQYDRLIENIKMRNEDLNVENEMDLQEITRLQNEQYNMYQLVKSIQKPLDEDKRNKARAVGGR